MKGEIYRLAETEGGETLVELTSSQKQTVEHQFDSFCKRVLNKESEKILCYKTYLQAVGNDLISV